VTDASLVLLVAFALDVALGDPPNALHPVAWLGRLASALLRRAPRTPPASAFLAGVGLVAAVVGTFVAAAYGIERSVDSAPRWLRVLVLAVALKSCFALRGLVAAARELVRAYERDGLSAARARLSWLCSRDASALEVDELANGTVESLAENFSDSVVAPLLFFAFFGLPGAAFYRATNTLDAMVGYRGEFEWLGKPAAKLDDLLNLVPARLSALAIGIAGSLLGSDVASALAVYRRDRSLTDSPNAGHPMAIAAGMLGLELDKPGVYVLGAGQRRPELADVERAVRLVALASLVFVLTLALGVARVSRG